MGAVEEVVGAGEPRPLRLDPKPGESLHGFIRRLAELELCTFRQMRGWLGLRATNGRRRLSGNLPRAAELCGLPVERLDRMGFEEQGRTWIAGISMPARWAMRERIRFCPACLAADAYHRSIWELGCIDVCPVHRTKLVDHCPDEACDVPLAWDRCSSDACHCTAQLSSAGASQMGIAGAAAAIVYERCGLWVDSRAIPAEFKAVPLDDLLELAGFLGRMEIVIVRGNPDGLSRARATVDPSVVEVGAEVLLGWPQAFFDLTARVGRTRPNARGARKFDRIHRLVRGSADRSFGAILRQAYRHFLEKHEGVPPESLPGFFGVKAEEDVYVTGMEARRILGISAQLMTRMRKTSLWEPLERATKTRGSVKLLPRSKVEELADRLSQAISFRQAAEMFGLDKQKGSRHVAKLVDGGLLDAIPFNGHREFLQMSVDRTQVEGILERIEGRVRAEPPKDPVTFSYVLHCASSLRGANQQTTHLFRAMLEGRFRGFLSMPEEIGIRRLSFDRSEMVEIVDAIATVAKSRLVSLEETAKILGVRTPMVHGLVRTALLPEPVLKGTTRLFNRADVDDFWKTYESATRLAVLRGVRSVTVERELEAMKIRPVATVEVDGRRGMSFYRKKDVDKLNP